jgi:hypothetical protein
MVRIATYSHDGAFMKSRAFAHDPTVTPATPSDGHMVMSLMPLHQLVRDSSRVLLVNGEDDEQRLTPPEAGQAFFAEVQSAMLVPVILEQQVLAVISIAEARPWDQHRFCHLDLLFVRSLAAVLALAIRFGLGGKATGTETNRAAWLPEASSQLRGRIKSSLSGILGSVEMIKSRHQTTDPAVEKYLSIIDKSAQRINDCFADHS